MGLDLIGSKEKADEFDMLVRLSATEKSLEICLQILIHLLFSCSSRNPTVFPAWLLLIPGLAGPFGL